MRVYLLLTFFLLCALAVDAQSEIEWRADYKLRLADFVASPVDTIPAEIYPDISVAYNLHTIHLFRKNYNQNVSSHFSKSTSFLRSPDSSALEFARTVFDLSEVMARELRKEFSIQRHNIYSHKANDIYQMLYQRFMDLRLQYATESEYGHNKERQAYWQQWVALQLFELTPYDKNLYKKKVAHHNGPPRYR